MQYNVDNSEIAVTLTSSKFDVAVTAQTPIEVAVGDAARIDVGAAVNYIKSGQAEIEQAVADGTAAFNLNAEQKTSDFNDNASSKTSDFNTNAINKTGDFDNNASAKTTDFNDNATNKTNAFNSNASDKTGDFNSNATSKTNAFNDNATEKTGDFNSNASDKTTDFNDNYTVKKGLIDAEVANAAASAAAAAGSAADAKQWAIGDPSEPTGNSAKYWADEAATTVSTKANVDLSNLSATGEAKFIKSVTTGATNGTISVDGSDVSVYGLGSAAYTASTAYATSTQGSLADTAVQPSDLALVATTGNYNDLTNKPTIPAAQVNSDWNAVSGVAEILNKPTIPTVDQTYGSTSANAQSGVAVASAISGKADDNAVVHLAGTETITGDKTFTGSLTIPANTLVTRQSYDSANEGGEIQFEVGTNSPLLSTVKVDVYQGRFRVFGTASNGDGREIINADIENNNLRAPASSAIDSVITTLALTLQDIADGANCVKLGNGVIVQWGYVGGSVTTHVVTFPVPFSSATSYIVTAVNRGFSGTVYTTNYNTTGVNIVTNTVGSIGWIAIGY